MTHRHLCEGECCCSSVDKSCLILSDPMDWMKHARLPIPLSPEFSVSCPLTQWHYITISSSVTLFSSFLQSFPTLGSFPRSELFASGGQSIGAFSISPSNEYSGLIFFQFSSVMSDSLWSHGLQHTRLPFHHHFPGFIQTQVHWVGDDIQPSHPLSLPSTPAFNLSQHQGLFHWGSSSH